VAAMPLAATPTRRLFFALWPDATVREAVRAAADAAAARAGIGGRRTPMERIHLTLLFLGELGAGDEARARVVAGSVRMAPFTLVLDRVGGFPRARVLWVGPRQAPPALTALHRELREGLGALVPDRRPLAPHLTCDRDASAPLPIAPIPPIPWAVDRFVLVHSEPRASGRYHVVSQWPAQT
jgi:RNA 2',3'-cyclic 3'-phosphodiesterase